MKEWQDVLDQLNKNKNPLYDLYKDATPDIGGDNITFYFREEEPKKAAQKKWQKLKKYLPPHWQQKRIGYAVGNSPSATLSVSAKGKTGKKIGTQKTGSSPRQALIHQELSDRADPALQAAVDAEKNCAALYKTLTEKTQLLATATVDVSFLWRVRVGGMRGFDELLLPAFHPIYGVPYVPASSLKGVIRAWARRHRPEAEVERLLGTLEGGVGRVQMFDAFPTAPCLDVDIATPQWHWESDRISYQPEPHALLSMLRPTFKIGLAPTGRGTPEDAATVREWVEPALSSGLGSRVSSGYGRTTLTSTSASCPSSAHPFELWTQGMYGIAPPTKENRWRGTPEFRPTAIRGVLRYWFRALALGLYPLARCRELEAELFGTIAPEPREGGCRVAVDWLEEPGNRTRPHLYEGEIGLEAKTRSHLRLLELLLHLATHLGGAGRGSRRPLHWNDPYPGLRGCYWAVESLKLPCRKADWQRFFEEIRAAFRAIASPQGTQETHRPGQPKRRSQDVLDGQARLFLVPCRGLKHPENVSNWKAEGLEVSVRGEALDLLYSSDRFKGKNQRGEGNENVGGGLETPSFVLIQSNFPEGGIPYQAVTIFGARGGDRATFAREVDKLDSIRIL